MNFIIPQCFRILKSEVINFNHVYRLTRMCSYKSAYCLENLYPNSKTKIYTPEFVSNYLLIQLFSLKQLIDLFLTLILKIRFLKIHLQNSVVIFL